MKIPKVYKKNGKKYMFIRKYPNFYLYADMSTGVKECFSKFDLEMLEETIAPPKCYKNVEKVKL